MNILIITRSTLFSVPGGDTVQIENTAKYLRLYGVNVDIKLSDENMDYSQYDLIHFFNIIRPNDIMYHMYRSKLPFVISPIFVDYSECEKKLRNGVLHYLNQILSNDMIEYLKVLARMIKGQEKIQGCSYFISGHRRSIEKVIKKAALLLPNSESEYKRIEKHFNVGKKYKVIPNGIDLDIFDYKGKETEDQYKDSIICVGRVEILKNQLNLIKAINRTKYTLFIIGKKSGNQLKYYKECLNEASKNDNIHFIDYVSQEKLFSIMKSAKVHALPSWFETTGLVSLEAAYSGCNIVITDKGDQREYFEDMATYCDPEDIESIVDALHVAYNKPFSEKLKEKIKNNYTWTMAAEETRKAYNEVMVITK